MLNKDDLDKKVAIIFLLVVVLANIIVYLIQSNWENGIDKNGYYTIGIVADYKSGRHGGNVYFKYTVDGELSENYTYSLKRIKIGTKYLVKFSSKKHKTSKMLINYPVTDTLNYVPNLGWQNIPFFIKKIK